MENNKYIKRILLVAIILVAMTIIDGDLYAQIDLPEDGEVNDTPAASISGLIGIAMAVGTYMGYKKLKK